MAQVSLQLGEKGREFRPEAVIFDFDGIIVDTEPVHFQAFGRVLAPLGIDISWEEYVDTYIGFDDRDAFREIFRGRGEELADGRLLELLEAKSVVFQEILRDGVRAYPGAVPLIGSLHGRGVPLAISSGALHSDIAPVLSKLGIADCFSAVVGAEDVKKSKPDPESYALAFERVRRAHPGRVSSPKRCLAVEDTPAGIRAAKAAGLRVLAVTNSFGGEELDGADDLVESLESVRLL